MFQNKRIRNFIYLFILLLVLSFYTGCNSKNADTVSTSKSTKGSSDGFGGFTSSNKNIVVKQNDTLTTTFSSPIQASTDVTATSGTTNLIQPLPNTPALATRKVVMTGTLDIETNKYDKAIDSISKLVQQSGGYIENSNMSGNKATNGNFLENRTSSYVIRIPASKFQYIMSSIGNLGAIINKTTNGEDVTYQFYDNQARLTTLKVKEARILEILKKTKVMQDVLSAENELQNTIYEIENLTSTQKKLSNLVEFSTVNISLREVTESIKLVKKPKNLGQRISYSFDKSIQLLVGILKGTIVLLVAVIPFAIILFIILILLWYFFKLRKKS